MPTATFSPGPTPSTVRAADGSVRPVPAGWVLVPPGDAALTRRLKVAGDAWPVAEKKGRKSFSRGTWAPAETVERLKQELAAERADPAHERKKQADAVRREKAQAAYVGEFEAAVTAFLRFHPVHADLAARLAAAVTAHATPVGSGTVARTARLPVEKRAGAAVVAWLRHQTTSYDRMRIARVKGERRAVRRELADRSRELLDRYRRGEPVAVGCPLAAAF
jgi:hypothetical protein